jgi:type IV pilus assembly protein PilW
MKMPYHRQAGFSLVEIMIATTLGLLLTSGVISVFISSKQAYNTNESIGRLQENGRLALFLIANDLRHANFWGPMLNVNDVVWPVGLALTGPCAAWASSFNDRFVATSEPGKSTALTTNCLTAEHIRDNTSAVAIKRVSQRPTDLGALSDNRIYLRAHSSDGEILVKGTSAGNAPVLSGYANWDYQPRVYFIRAFSVTSGDNIPSLCLVEGNPSMRTQCIVEGVESMHIEYGIDRMRNGVPDYFEANPTAAEAEDAVAIRLYLVVRDTEVDTSVTGSKTYRLGSKTVVTPDDHFRRAVFSTTVIPHNQRTLPIR